MRLFYYFINDFIFFNYSVIDPVVRDILFEVFCTGDFDYQS